MALPRPTILSVITVPSGGWNFKLYVSRVTQYDTTVTANIAAGDYFLSWDNQSDDFLYAFTNAVNAAIDAAHAAYPTDSFGCYLDSNNKVNIAFENSYYQGDPARGIKLAWTESDGDDIAKVLGFDYSADDTNTSAGGSNNKTFTADWQHGYGWYADEDGLLKEYLVEDINEVHVIQSRSHSGVVRTQRIASRYVNSLSLQFLSRKKTYSRGISYGETSLSPYEMNEGLECWWRRAQEGYRFRFYRDGRRDAASATVQGTATSSTTTTLTDSGRSWDIDPQAYKSKLLYLPTHGTNIAALTARYFISSHTATVLTVSNVHPYALASITSGGTGYYIFDQPYQTYIVNLEAMNTFAPQELPALDRYSITIPLYRYES